MASNFLKPNNFPTSKEISTIQPLNWSNTSVTFLHVDLDGQMQVDNNMRYSPVILFDEHITSSVAITHHIDPLYFSVPPAYSPHVPACIAWQRRHALPRKLLRIVWLLTTGIY